MNLKWAFGAVLAVLVATVALPGIASAGGPYDESYIEASSSTVCDGTFDIALDFHGDPNGGDAYVEVEGGSYAEDPLPDGMTATGSEHPEFVDGASPNEWDFEPGVQDDFFTLSGDFDSVEALPDQAVDVDYRVEWNGNNDVRSSGGITVTAGPDGDDNADNDWEKCIINYCEAGDAKGGSNYSFQATPESNCGFFNACINGEVERINEYDAEQAGYEEGVCDHENPPPPPPAEEDPPVTEEEPEEVAEVAPSVDEVAALPSAGFGTWNQTGLAWMTLLAFALIGAGGATLAMARRK